MKTNCSVFLIDNDKDEEMLFNDIIDHYNLPFTVHHFSTLEQMKSYLKTGDLPDGIILNVSPWQKGWVEWLKEVKNDPSFANIPVILYCINFNYEMENLQSLPSIFCHYQKPTTGKGFIDILQKIQDCTNEGQLKKVKETMQH
jgi:hypothetical protein